MTVMATREPPQIDLCLEMAVIRCMWVVLDLDDTEILESRADPASACTYITRFAR